jgi:hypothetical protein
VANEIRVLEGDGRPDPSRAPVYSVLFLFPIGTPKVAGPPGGSATNAVYTPSAGLTRYALQVTTAAERASMDAGTLAWRIVSFAKDPARTDPQLATDLQQMYAATLTAMTNDYNSRYQHLGTVLTAP